MVTSQLMIRQETKTRPIDRVTSWEQFDELEAAGLPIPPMDIRAGRRIHNGPVVTTWEQFGRLEEQGLPIPPLDIDTREPNPQKVLIENIVGPNGEVFKTREDYLRFELNDALRVMHENAVSERTTPPTRLPRRSKPQGLLAAVAGMDRSPVTIPEICGWNEMLPSDNLRRAADILVEEGLFEAKPNQYGGRHPAYGLTVSSLDSGKVFEEMVAKYDRPKREKTPRQGLLRRRKPQP